MKFTWTFLFLLHQLTSCDAVNTSKVITGKGKSLNDAAAYLTEAAQILNVAEPGNWANYMESRGIVVTRGIAHVGTETLASVIANWSIPRQFLAETVQSVNLLVTAAAEGWYSAQTFVFDIQADGILSTLLVAVSKLDSPSDPNTSVVIFYAAIETYAGIKQQYTPYDVQRCHSCIKCVWISRCCCHTVTEYSPRGNTPEELLIIKQKLTADQYAWLNAHPFSDLLKRTILEKKSSQSNIALHEALEKFLSNRTSMAEILTSYNESVLSALQSNIGSLKSSSQSLKLKRIAQNNALVLLSTLAKDYDFEDITNNTQFLQQFQAGRFSYENFFTTSCHNNQSQIGMKYIWIVGQRLDITSYSMNFLSVNFTSQRLINTLLSNNTDIDQSSNITDEKNQVKIVRLSMLNDQGQFLNEYLSTLITPWNMSTTRIALNILRYSAASVLLPRQNRMLSYFDSVTSSTPEDNRQTKALQGRAISATILALSSAISAGANAWTAIVNAFRTTSSTTVTRITRLGFTHFAQRSTVLKAMNMPADRAAEFVNALVVDYNIPTNASFTLALTYSEELGWDQTNFFYSLSNDGYYRSLTLFKTGDSLTNTASFLLVSINTELQLAPDLLIVQSSRSILGGLFQKNRQSIEEVPHAITKEEILQLQDFYMLVALQKITSTLRFNVTLPSLE